MKQPSWKSPKKIVITFYNIFTNLYKSLNQAFIFNLIPSLGASIPYVLNLFDMESLPFLCVWGYMRKHSLIVFRFLKWYLMGAQVLFLKYLLGIKRENLSISKSKKLRIFLTNPNLQRISLTRIICTLKHIHLIILFWTKFDK